MEIDEGKKAYANRLFQCLAISTRPLRVKELAELFAVLPDAESALGLKFNIGWRPQDPEEFILPPVPRWSLSSTTTTTTTTMTMTTTTTRM